MPLIAGMASICQAVIGNSDISSGSSIGIGLVRWVKFLSIAVMRIYD